jgi:UDP-N-acetylglucosamine 3-dehydrogenase
MKFKQLPTYYHKLLTQNLDAVSIVVPTMPYRQVALDAIAAGTNVLIEKQIADTLENANTMIMAVKIINGALNEYSYIG